MRRLAFLAVLFGMGSLASGQSEFGPRVPRTAGPPALGPATARVSTSPSRGVHGAFGLAASADAGLTVRMDLGALRGVTDDPGGFVIHDFPLTPTRFVDLEVEEFHVTTPRSRFAVGPDGHAGFDPSGVMLLRGRVSGYPHSSVYLGLADIMSRGTIDLGAGHGEFAVSSRLPGGGSQLPGQLGVYTVRGDGPSATCELEHEDPPKPEPDPSIPPPTDELRRGLRQVELAVETDLEFFLIFGDVNAANTYLVELYGAVSDVFMREINVRVDLVYARVWTTPTPFSAGLGFSGYWEANMGSVHRDLAQMFSGRPDLPGGQAWLNGVCNGVAYSFCGNAQARFEDPFGTGQWRYDVHVTAHELGHNFGTNHTDVYGLDNCGSVNATPQRGTIMSYCNQTVSGGQTVIDMGFHTRTRRAMNEFLQTVTLPACLVFDCNQNGVSDAIDIATGAALDVNANGVPDPCEDCNLNGVLDPQDISVGTSRDLNTNGVPDECEPDCNSNNVPDDRDIDIGTSQDVHGDGVPDECDADLNGNGLSDYNELSAEMPLDRNRNRTLDAVEDCDGDTVPDLTELDAAHDVWAGSRSQGTLRRFHAVTGVLMQQTTGTSAPCADVLVTPERRVLASAYGSDRIAEFDASSGVFLRDLVAAGSGGLDQPAGMLISPSGTLLVASEASNRVLEYDRITGAFLRTLIPPGAGGLAGPWGLAIGPDGLLYVSTSGALVLRYNVSTGAFVSQFVAPGSGGLASPRALMFLPGGKLLVASSGNNRVLAYDPTGAFLEVWAKTGVAFSGPWGLRMARNGNVLVSASGIGDTHVTRARIHEFDVDNGYWVRGYVLGSDTGLSLTSGFDIVPDGGADCNNNQRPDNCDIAGGFSPDLNKNAVPDECEEFCYPDCNADGVLNLADFGCFTTRFTLGLAYADCNGDDVRNLADFGCFTTRFALGCP